MSLEGLKQAIHQEVEQRTKAIEHRYETLMAQEQERLKNKAKQLEGEIIEQAQRQGQAELARAQQAARLAARADVLRVKQAELDRLKQAMVAQILAWPPAELHEFLASLLKPLLSQKGEVVAGEKHHRALHALSQQLNFTLSQQTIPAEGGFIYRTAYQEINLTIRQLVNFLFERHRAKMAQELFS